MNPAPPPPPSPAHTETSPPPLHLHHHLLHGTPDRHHHHTSCTHRDITITTPPRPPARYAGMPPPQPPPHPPSHVHEGRWNCRQMWGHQVHTSSFFPFILANFILTNLPYRKPRGFHLHLHVLHTTPLMRPNAKMMVSPPPTWAPGVLLPQLIYFFY